MASEESPAEADTGSSLLLNQPVVIDNGTATLKAGFAGSTKPKVSRDKTMKSDEIFVNFILVTEGKVYYFAGDSG